MNNVIENHGIKFETLESFGKKVGLAIARTGKKDILYKLRNVRNPTDFLHVMSEISYKLNVKTPMEILKIAFPFDINHKDKYPDNLLIEFVKKLLFVIINDKIIAINSKNQKKNESQ